jgi:hypothetical protein
MSTKSRGTRPFDPNEDGLQVELRWVSDPRLRVQIETPLYAGKDALALAADLHQEIQFWLSGDHRGRRSPN